MPQPLNRSKLRKKNDDVVTEFKEDLKDLKDLQEQAANIENKETPESPSIDEAPTSDTAPEGVVTAAPQAAIINKHLRDAAEAAASAAEIHKNAKLETLDELVVMREDRTNLIDRVNVVLAELQLKGGEVEGHEVYVTKVSGIVVDIQDAQSTWSSVTGWLVSGEGGLRVAKKRQTRPGNADCICIARMGH